MDNKAKILIVDDSESIRQNLAAILTKEGYSITTAENGATGLQKIKVGHPDLVILDLVMPTLDGMKVCNAMKGDPELKKIPVLMNTSKGSKDDIIQGLEAGANDYIVKPFHEEELLARVHSLLRSGSMVKQLERDKLDLLAILEISNAITSTLDSREVLYSIVKKISEIIHVIRCSIVRIDSNESKGYVVATNEDPNIYNLVIDLKKYPEINEALQTREIVIINDTAKDPIVGPVREVLSRINIHSLLVLPVIMKQNVIGTLLLRTSRKEHAFTEREIQLCQIVANASANALINASLFESMELANIQLERLATTDGLTNIFNHRYFYMRLDEEFNRSERYRTPLSVIMSDVNNFKTINDTYGHRTGDLILKELARILKTSIRKSDIVARYGGDEFVILLPQTDRKGAEAEAARIIKAISEHKFTSMEGLSPTISHGISTYPDPKITKADDLVKLADRQLYILKNEQKKDLVAPHR
ncbi:MAG: diguanylate cyclase [Deltaproteobacteria bacterium]|nr:diguanylate cyclase [Deltaproteobacteria bacterium]